MLWEYLENSAGSRWILSDQGYAEGSGGWLGVSSIYCLILLLVVERQTVCNFVKFPWGGLELCSYLVEHSPWFLIWELIPVCGNTWVFCVTLMRTSSLTDCGYSEGKGGFWRRKGRWVILVYKVYCWLRPGNGLEANKFYRENTLAPVRTRVSVLDEDCSCPGPESPWACGPE